MFSSWLISDCLNSIDMRALRKSSSESKSFTERYVLLWLSIVVFRICSLHGLRGGGAKFRQHHRETDRGTATAKATRVTYPKSLWWRAEAKPTENSSLGLLISVFPTIQKAKMFSQHSSESKMFLILFGIPKKKVMNEFNHVTDLFFYQEIHLNYSSLALLLVVSHSGCTMYVVIVACHYATE